jgi:hypothetical protein
MSRVGDSPANRGQFGEIVEDKRNEKLNEEWKCHERLFCLKGPHSGGRMTPGWQFFSPVDCYGEEAFSHTNAINKVT